MSLLTEAKKVHRWDTRRLKVTTDLVELAVAYFSGDVTAGQAVAVLRNRKIISETHRCYPTQRLGVILRNAIINGKVEIHETNKRI